MRIKKLCVLFLIFLFISQFVFSESFRVRKVVTMEMTDETANKSITLGMGEALHLILPENRVFMQGVQLKIKIPASLAEYGGAVAYSFYGDVSPNPSADIIDYNAERLLIGTFTNRLTYHLDIPLSDDLKPTTDPYTKIIQLPYDQIADDIFFRAHIVMKGIPDGLWDSSIEIEVKPILANKGLLDLSILYPPQVEGSGESYPFIVFIDDDLTDFTGEPLLLSTGMHHVTVSSEFFRNEVQTFAIEKASTTNLEIQLKDIAPLLAVSAPENAKFFLNDVEYVDFSSPIKVTTGTHQLRFSIGEYEIIRTIEVLNGRTYNIDVSFDVDITEE